MSTSFLKDDDLPTVDVAIQDQHTDIVNLKFTKFIQQLILTQHYERNIRTIVVSAAQAPVAGNTIILPQATHHVQFEIVSVTPVGNNYSILLDTPLPNNIEKDLLLKEVTNHIQVDGSVTPVVFSIDMADIETSIAYDLTLIKLHILDNAEMDDSKFGGINSLTNGIVLRVVNNNVINNICNIKNNTDLANIFGQVEYKTKAPSGYYGITATMIMQSLFGVGVVTRLTSETNDRIELVVQDNLTGLTHLHAIGAGHVTLD
jgi:hypothetical protein